MNLDFLSKIGQYHWAGWDRYAWLGWLILLAALWGPLRARFGARWSLPWVPRLGLKRGRGGVRPGPKAGLSPWSRLVWLPGLLRLAGLALLWLALLRPQIVSTSTSSSTQALDIYLCLDLSGSMQAQDLKPNRVTAAKEVLENFVDQDKGDRIGLVVFAGKAFVQCPLSLDHDIVKYFINQVSLQTVSIDGTAMGDGLLTAVQRLVKDPSRNQIIILATDGVNNAGVDPRMAAQVAAKAGIRVYTIGMGVKGGAYMYFQNAWGQQERVHFEEPDTATLTYIADATGGEYFRATDRSALEQIFSRIADLTKHDVNVRQHQDATDYYFPFLVLGALCLGAEALLRLRIRNVV